MSMPPEEDPQDDWPDRCTCARADYPAYAHDTACRIYREFLHAHLVHACRVLEESTDYPHLRSQLQGAAAAMGHLLGDPSGFSPLPGLTQGPTRAARTAEPGPTTPATNPEPPGQGHPDDAQLTWEHVSDDTSQPSSEEASESPYGPPAPEAEDHTEPALGEGTPQTETSPGGREAPDTPEEPRAGMGGDNPPQTRPEDNTRDQDTAQTTPASSESAQSESYWDMYDRTSEVRFGDLDFTQFQKDPDRIARVDQRGKTTHASAPPTQPAGASPAPSHGERHGNTRPPQQRTPTSHAETADTHAPQATPPTRGDTETPTNWHTVLSDDRDLGRYRTPPTTTTIDWDWPRQSTRTEGHSSTTVPRRWSDEPTTDPGDQDDPTEWDARTEAWQTRRQDASSRGYYAHLWQNEQPFTNMEEGEKGWEPFSETRPHAEDVPAPPQEGYSWHDPCPYHLYTGVVYLFTRHPTRDYLYLAALRYTQKDTQAPLLGITNPQVDNPTGGPSLPWAHRDACRLLLQKQGLHPSKYRLYPTAFRIPMVGRHRPLSGKSTHAAATLAILESRPAVLDSQAPTGEEEYFSALSTTKSRWLYLGTRDAREWSSTVSWTAYHTEFRAWNKLQPIHWTWLNQITNFVVARHSTPTTWDSALVDLPYPTDSHVRSTSETALRARLCAYALPPWAQDLESHLRRSYAPSAARVLQWEPEATWTRSRAIPYFPGHPEDWEEHAILSVEPCWVQQWTT